MGTEKMTDRNRSGMTDLEIERRVPDQGKLWRAKMGDVIVYFESVYGKGIRDALGVDLCDAAAFHGGGEATRTQCPKNRGNIILR